MLLTEKERTALEKFRALSERERHDTLVFAECLVKLQEDGNLESDGAQTAESCPGRRTARPGATLEAGAVSMARPAAGQGGQQRAQGCQDRNEETRMLINKLIQKIDNEQVMQSIYRYVNDIFCKS